MKYIDLEKLVTEMDPMSMKTQLMNPEKINTEEDNPMCNLIQNITQSVQSKIQNGEIDEEKLGKKKYEKKK